MQRSIEQQSFLVLVTPPSRAVRTARALSASFPLDVASLDEALEIARQCPAARFATVEVRECAPCNA